MDTTNKNRFLPRPLEDDDYDQRREMERQKMEKSSAQGQTSNPKTIYTKQDSLSDDVSLTDKFDRDDDPEIIFLESAR